MGTFVNSGNAAFQVALSKRMAFVPNEEIWENLILVLKSAKTQSSSKYD